MIVGVCRITLQLEDCHSDKDKRSVLRRIKDRVHQKWNCAIAEVGDGDSWDTAQLGFVVLSNQRGYTQSQVQKILQFIDDLAFARITDDEQDFIDYGDGAVEDVSRGSYEHWEPADSTPTKSAAKLLPPRVLEPAEYPWDSPESAAPDSPKDSKDSKDPNKPGNAEP